MEWQFHVSACTHTKVFLSFTSLASKHDEEYIIGSYVCSVPNSHLENFMEQAAWSGGKLEEEMDSYMCYSFKGVDALLVVDKLAHPYMFLAS